MKPSKLLITLLALGVFASLAFGQRRNQIEFYGGAAFPLAPETFKDYTKVGLSGNAQYVLFPSPRLGITFNVGYEAFSTDDEKFTDALSTEFTGQTASYWVGQGFGLSPSATVKSNLLRIGAGVRPYLTDPEANTQFFLLGQVNFNLIKNDFSAKEIPYQYDAVNDQLFFLTFNDEEYEQNVEENDDNVVGIGAGAGVEIPAGSSFNIVLQGLFNILFTADESTSFVGVTAGVVF